MFEIDVKKNFEYCNKNDFSSVYRVKAEENSLSSMYMEEYKNIDLVNNLKKTIDKALKDRLNIKECL